MVATPPAPPSDPIRTRGAGSFGAIIRWYARCCYQQ